MAYCGPDHMLGGASPLPQGLLRLRSRGDNSPVPLSRAQAAVQVAATPGLVEQASHAASATQGTSRESEMKAVVYDAPRQYAVREVPDPVAGPGQVRIKVNQVGMCGTDLHIHHGDFNAVFPLIPGHELVGTVDALGDQVTRFRVGEQVTVNPNIYCGKCEYCLAGRLILCRNMKGLGSNYPGFFAEYVSVSEDLVFSVEGIDPDTAVFTEPAACAMHGLESLQVRPGATALVFGAGPTGLLLAQLIKSGGASSVTVAAPTQFK